MPRPMIALPMVMLALLSGCGPITPAPTATPPPSPSPEPSATLTPTASASSTSSPEPSPTAVPSATLEPIVYEAWSLDVVNLLSDLCGRCHNPATMKGELDLTSYEGALAGGGSGPAIMPGNPDASELVRVQKRGGHSEMLSDAQLAAIIEWIRAGAPQE